MMQMTKMQRDAEDAAWLARQAADRAAHEKAKADKAEALEEPSEWELEVEAWEKSGMDWLKAGEKLFGPRYDYQMELGRLGRFYSRDRTLPYEDLNAFGVYIYAGFRALMLHGLIALVLSLLAVICAVPIWLCVIASVLYIGWRFRARREWILQQRAEAELLRAEVLPSRGLSHDAK